MEHFDEDRQKKKRQLLRTLSLGAPLSGTVGQQSGTLFLGMESGLGGYPDSDDLVELAENLPQSSDGLGFPCENIPLLIFRFASASFGLTRNVNHDRWF